MSLRPLRDLVVLKRLEYQNPILYVAGIKLNKGEVIAIGPGRRMRRKVRFDRVPGKQDGSIWVEDGAETGAIRPMRVKVGDAVEFGFRQGTEVEIGGEQFVIVPEQAIYGRDPAGSQSQAIIAQQSAGYDKAGNFVA